MHRIHKIKTVAPYYEDIALGRKIFEWRLDDRSYETEDILMHCEWLTERKKYSGKSCLTEIVYKLSGGQFGMPSGYCILGIQLCEEKEKR